MGRTFGDAKASRFSRLAVESARNNDAKETAALWQANEALREAQFGNDVAAHQQANATFVLAPGKDVRVLAALALARSGDISPGQKLADRLSADFPSDTLIQRSWLPTVRAEIELHSGKAKAVLELLNSTAPYELGEGRKSPCLYAVYVRGDAYLRAKESEAASEFQKILQRSVPPGPYSMQGDTAKARTAYKDFLTLWKDADSGIPVLKEAKAEYAKLQ